MSWTRIGGWLLILAFVIAFGIGFGVLSARILTGIDGEAALALVTFVATTWFAIWSFQKTKRKEAEAQLFSEKAQIYKEIVDILRDIVFAQKGWGPEVDNDELAERFGRVRFDLIIWGGQDTIRAITALEDAGGDDIGKTFAAATNLYAQIRKELGHDDDAALAEDLFLTQIINDEREAARALIRASRTPN